MDLVTVAAAPVNIRHWRTPEVVVYFPSGVTTEVAAAIAELGATVADGPGKHERLAGVPALFLMLSNTAHLMSWRVPVNCLHSSWQPCWLHHAHCLSPLFCTLRRV